MDVDPEFEKLTAEMAMSLMEKIDALLTSLSNLFNYWLYKKQNVTSIEMTVRTELRIIDDPMDCISDVDLDDLIYVDVSRCE